ncbi:hypothetical protein ACVILE_001715 [Streptomyces sp. M18.1]
MRAAIFTYSVTSLLHTAGEKPSGLGRGRKPLSFARKRSFCF